MMSSVDQVAPTPDPDAPMGSGRRRGLFVAGAGAVTTLVWSVGLNRAWGWDESVTVGTFATVPSLYQAATRGGLENHVLASLAAAAVHTITGSTDEVVLRLVFLAAGVLTVVLLAWALSRRFGIAAAAGGVAVFAANPMVIDQMRQVRGYAFLVVCAVASTLVLLSMLGRSSVSWWWPLGYGALLALGIGAHLYMMGVIVVHLAVVAARRRVDGRFAVIWGAALVAGLALNAMTLLRGLRWTTGRQFSPSFPVDLARELLGQSPIAVVAIAILLGLAVPVLWRRREVRWSAAAVLVLVLGCWVV